VLINRGHSSAKETHSNKHLHKLVILFFESILLFIMGIFTFEDETTSPVAPATLYKALVTDADNVIPKAVEAFRSVENLEGNGGPGTIKKITFVEGTHSLTIYLSIYLCSFYILPYSITKLVNEINYDNEADHWMDGQMEKASLCCTK